MGTPKKRRSHSRSAMGRAHKSLSRYSLSDCPRCGEKRRPHRVCSNCGTYATRGRERQVVDVEAETE